MDMKLPEVVTPPSIYHGCSTRKMFWEEKFTGEEKLLSAVNMKNCGHHNVRKHREIKGSDKYVTLDISLKIDSLDKVKITSLESKEKLGRSGKGLISSLGLKAKVRPHKYKKARYAMGNVSNKDLSKIIREFEKLPYESYEKNMPKHEPSESYFYLVRHLANSMMGADALNLHIYPVRTEITAPSLHICSTDESKLTKIYRRAVPRMRMNQKASSLMNVLRRTMNPNRKAS